MMVAAYKKGALQRWQRKEFDGAPDRNRTCIESFGDSYSIH